MTTMHDSIRTRPGVGAALVAFAVFLVLMIGSYQIGARGSGLDGLFGSGGGSRLRTAAILGGRHDASTVSDLTGADVAAVFGSCRLDLTQADLAAGGGVIDAFVLFGHADIRVPSDWSVHAGGTSVFGAVNNRTRRAGADPAKRLRVRGLVVFGGVTVGH